MNHRVLLRALRLILGALMVATGVGKALDVRGFAAVLQTYQLGLHDTALLSVALAVTAAELALGAWILSGRHLARAACASMALNALYFVVLTATLWRGIEIPNCGCFGVFLAEPLRWYTPLEELFIIGLSWLLFRVAPTRSS